jgi:flagellar hook-length control protein FliK
VGGGGGASGGAGFGHEFGGLFAGGRAFGVGFGTPAKGKTAVGVASAKGESKEQIQAQISRGLAAALRQKGGVMSLRLNPEHLGSMKIDLTIEGGRVTATFDAQSEQARQALRDGVDGLKRSIEEAGLTVKSIDVVGTTPLATTNPPSGRDDRSSQTAGDATGQHGQNGDQSGGKERREHSAPWAQEQPEAQVSPEAVGPGGVWAEEDGSASGLLRLRVDAVV